MIRASRRAGISVPLFSLRSTRSWGIGEIGDIPAAASWLRAGQQSVLQILPLNELAPGEASPYSALSAMAIDPQFISIGMLNDGPLLEQILRDDIERARRSATVAYEAVRDVKTRALRAVFDRFLKTEWRPNSGHASNLRSYITRESWWLDEYSLYRALRAESGERPWPEWPPSVRDRDPAALSAARERLAGEMLFLQYVQWIADEQWQAVRRKTKGVQIFGDCPFMVTLDSADVWSNREDFIMNASVGTPPDAFSETGQEWGLPPYNWERARTNDFHWLRLRARRLAELYDGFRVDHLVGFYRTYVRPLDGSPPYFMPPHEDEQRQLGEATMAIMMGSGADVSVEDLGTVPPFVRESIARLGLPGYKVLRWEVDDPTTFPPLSVAMTGTHDTEPIAAWWETLTSIERMRFGFELRDFDATVRDAILSRIYHAGSNLVLLPLQDVFGWPDRINQPATISGANWTYALPWPVDEWPAHPDAQAGAHRLAGLTSQTGRWHPPETDG